MSELRKSIVSRIDRTFRYGVNDDYTSGYLDGLGWALHRVIETEDANRNTTWERSES